jgi:ParB family chromosome partitioning protein
MTTKKRPLGRGIEALIPKNTDSKPVTEIDIVDIMPNKEQPRKSFDKDKLNELVESIRKKGVIQPILVYRDGRRYVIIAGERRWRAAGLAGLKKIPAVIKNIESEKERLELAIIENIQREDLNPVELAKAYKNLTDRYGYTQEELASIMGKSRSSVTNTMRILTLPDEVLEAIQTKKITEGHARTLITLDSVEEILILLKEIIRKELSVRETEKLIKSVKNKTKQKKEENKPNIFLEELKNELEKKFNTKINIKNKKKGGIIEIKYSSGDEFERIISVLRGELK